MRNDPGDSMREKILELSAEDDYGVWEMAWATGIRSSEDPRIDRFQRTLQDLVRDGRIIAKRQNSRTKKLEPVELRVEELQAALNRLQRPNPDLDYWFGI
jgi:hypothetical protein